MPRYFFRLSNGDVMKDHEGEELADHEAACAVALEVFAETIPSKRATLAKGGHYEVMVTDEDAAPVYSVTANGRCY